MSIIDRHSGRLVDGRTYERTHTQYQMVFILHIYIRRVTEFGSLPSIFVVVFFVFQFILLFSSHSHTRTHIFCLVSAGVKCCKLFYEGGVAAFHQQRLKAMLQQTRLFYNWSWHSTSRGIKTLFSICIESTADTTKATNDVLPGSKPNHAIRYIESGCCYCRCFCIYISTQRCQLCDFCGTKVAIFQKKKILVG